VLRDYFWITSFGSSIEWLAEQSSDDRNEQQGASSKYICRDGIIGCHTLLRSSLKRRVYSDKAGAALLDTNGGSLPLGAPPHPSAVLFPHETKLFSFFLLPLALVLAFRVIVVCLGILFVLHYTELLVCFFCSGEASMNITQKRMKCQHHAKSVMNRVTEQSRKGRPERRGNVAGLASDNFNSNIITRPARAH
jgi:hypothetical protein